TRGDFSFRNITQGFFPRHVEGHNESIRATAYLYRNGYYLTRVIFTDYRHCTILRTETYNN
ncbi:unnamed protein product, partial [Ixodes hexagonus]